MYCLHKKTFLQGLSKDASDRKRFVFYVLVLNAF